MVDQDGPGVLVPVPLGEQRVFRNQAMDDILEFLFRNPHGEFGVRQLRDLTGHGGKTVDTALTLFEQLGLIEDRREGNRRLVSINRDRVQKPDDPLLEIPQEQFRDPVGEFSARVVGAQDDNLVGILLFGSVARGEADRTSDIDVQVIVANDLLASRRRVHNIRQEIEEERFGDERYEFQVLVESLDTAEQHGEKLQEIFSEAIAVHSTERLAALREVILDGR